MALNKGGEENWLVTTLPQLLTPAVRVTFYRRLLLSSGRITQQLPMTSVPVALVEWCGTVTLKKRQKSRNVYDFLSQFLAQKTICLSLNTYRSICTTQFLCSFSDWMIAGAVGGTFSGVIFNNPGVNISINFQSNVNPTS